MKSIESPAYSLGKFYCKINNIKDKSIEAIKKEPCG